MMINQKKKGVDPRKIGAEVQACSNLHVHHAPLLQKAPLDVCGIKMYKISEFRCVEYQ